MWLGFDTLLSRQVAVKVLKAALATDPVVTERFRREAIAVAQLSHPNIVSVYDSIEEGGRQAVVMQLVSGKSLRQLLDEQKRLSPDLTMHIGSCVASALDAAHQAGLVHRDVKPGNILITPDGRVLLADFGIAKGVEPSSDDLTNENTMMGTAKYLSPEQVRGKRLDGRADLYALGLVLYECLAGRVPFVGQNDVETALARLQRDPTNITQLRPTLPYGLADVIHRLLARRPDDRYSSGATVRIALSEVASRVNDPTFNDRSGSPLRPDRTPTGQIKPPTPTGVRRTTVTPNGGTGRAPVAVGGYQPVRAGGRPAGVPVIRTDRDQTPTGQSRVQQRPNRKFEHRRGPSLVIVSALLIAAVVVSTVLWGTLGADGGTKFIVPISSTTPVVALTVAPSVATGEAKIVRVIAFDPDGDGIENDEQAVAAVDGNPSTAWTTVCYSSKFLGGKGGVGLVVTLGAASAGRLTVDIASAPWNIQLFATSADALPLTIGAWGEPIASDNNTAARIITVPITSAARQFLVLLRELGSTSNCSADNPFRGAINEISFEASS